MADHTIDAQENPLTNMINFNVHVHHKHVSLTGHLLGIATLLMNRSRYDALPAELRGLLDAAVRDSEAAQRALAEAEDAVCLARLSDSGVAIVSADAIDFPAFHAVITV